MYVFDAPMHGKSISTRDFSSKYVREPYEQDAAAEDGQGGARHGSRWWDAFSVCGAGAMALVHAQRVGAGDVGPEAGLLHFFLAAFLPLRIYGRLCFSAFPERTYAVWPSLALHATVMLCAYPYERERVSAVVFGACVLCVGLHASAGFGLRSLAANAATLLVMLNAVLCLLVYANDSRLGSSYYHASFVAACVALASF
jgi:hypothetical protein